MARSRIRFLGFGCLVAVVSLPCISAGDSGKRTAHSFKITIASDIAVDTLGNKQKVDAFTELRYTWKNGRRARILTFDSAQVNANVDGKPLMNVFMSREKFKAAEQGQIEEVPFKDAPDELKKVLQDSFGAPLCELQIDGHGKEIKRTVVAGPGAKDVIGNGMIENALIFHPPFLRGQDQWQADTEVSMGNGRYAKGKLTYKRMAEKIGGLTFAVSGTLTNDGFKKAGTPVTIKNTIYVVNGAQTYSSDQQEWDSGKLTIDISFQMTTDEKPIGSAKGKMVLDFQKLPENK